MDDRKLQQLEKILTHSLSVLDSHDYVSSNDLTQILEGMIKVIQDLKINLDGNLSSTKEELYSRIRDNQYGLNALEIKIDGLLNSKDRDNSIKLRELSQKITAELKRIENSIKEADFLPIENRLNKIERKISKPIDEQTGEIIVNKINELPIEPEYQIDIEHIKGYKDLKKNHYHGGVLHVYTDSTMSGDGTVSNPLHVISAGSGGTTTATEDLSSQVGTGTTSLTVTYVPLWIFVNGLSYFENDAYTRSNGAITWTAFTIASGSKVVSVNNGVAVGGSANFLTDASGTILTDASGTPLTVS